jgi:hypothetical protein
MQITHFYCQISMKSEFSGQILEKYSNIKFHKKYFLWERCWCMRTDQMKDRYDEANNLFSQLCNTILMIILDSILENRFVTRSKHSQPWL